MTTPKPGMEEIHGSKNLSQCENAGCYDQNAMRWIDPIISTKDRSQDDVGKYKNKIKKIKKKTGCNNGVYVGG
jgi:acetyl-CoA carboxylase beta subunit